MSPQRHISEPPSWEELRKAMAADATPELRMEITARLKITTPSDEAVLGARDFLEDNDYNFDALREFILPEDHPVAKPPTTSRPLRPLFYRIAAAAAILATLVYGGSSLQKAQRHREMTQKVFYEPGLPVFAGLGGDRIFHEMMTSFRLLESAEGLRYIDTLEQLYGRNDTLSYFAGWLHYFDKDYASAARRFEEVAFDSSSFYHEKSELMAAATLILDEKKDDARVRLERILKRPAYLYRKEAEGLLSSAGN
jgi:hypothetical protein